MWGCFRRCGTLPELAFFVALLLVLALAVEARDSSLVVNNPFHFDVAVVAVE